MKTRIRYLILAGLLSCCVQGYGQEDSISPRSGQPPVILLKWSLLNLLDPIPSGQIGLEYRTHSGSTLILEAGYIHHNFNPFYWHSIPFTHLDGYRVRAAYRQYSNLNPNLYWAGELHYFYYEMDHYRNYGVNCFDQACTWYKLEEIRAIKSGYTLHSKLGLNVPQWKNALLDIYGGIGVRVTHVDLDHEPAEGIRQIPAGFFGFYRVNDFGTSISPSFTFGIKLGVFLTGRQ